MSGAARRGLRAAAEAAGARRALAVPTALREGFANDARRRAYSAWRSRASDLAGPGLARLPPASLAPARALAPFALGGVARGLHASPATGHAERTADEPAGLSKEILRDVLQVRRPGRDGTPASIPSHPSPERPPIPTQYAVRASARPSLARKRKRKPRNAPPPLDRSPPPSPLPFTLPPSSPPSSLQNANPVAVRGEIRALLAPPDAGAAATTHLSLADFDALLANHGFDTADAREAALKAFRDAGVVTTFEDLVYLDPKRVTADVLRVLPAAPARVFGMSGAEMDAMRAEAEALATQVEEATRRAKRRSQVIVGSGLLMLCTQFALFLRLTYVEFSWDVMEPISYFVGAFNAILIYAYFMVNQSDFSFDDWSTRMARFFSKNEARRRGIDYERYNAIARRLRK